MTVDLEQSPLKRPRQFNQKYPVKRVQQLAVVLGFRLRAEAEEVVVELRLNDIQNIGTGKGGQDASARLNDGEVGGAITQLQPESLGQEAELTIGVFGDFEEKLLLRRKKGRGGK